MKEFEKWSKEYYPDNVAVFYCNQKEGWKAALKWILEKSDDLSFTYDTETEQDNGVVLGLSELDDIIKEELENE